MHSLKHWNFLLANQNSILSVWKLPIFSDIKFPYFLTAGQLPKLQQKSSVWFLNNQVNLIFHWLNILFGLIQPIPRKKGRKYLAVENLIFFSKAVTFIQQFLYYIIYMMKEPKGIYDWKEEEVKKKWINIHRT